MKDCCEVRADVPERQRRVLQVVLWINVAMFLVEFISGIRANSTSGSGSRSAVPRSSPTATTPA